ncbi:MAG TPA: hypothetical protein VGK17_09560 [Propionicimonas sp.]|jgi:hypothetical protein
MTKYQTLAEVPRQVDIVCPVGHPVARLSDDLVVIEGSDGGPVIDRYVLDAAGLWEALDDRTFVHGVDAFSPGAPLASPSLRCPICVARAYQLDAEGLRASRAEYTGQVVQHSLSD